MTERRRWLSGEGWTAGDRSRRSSGQKMEVVLRVLRGEDLDTLGRELHVAAAAIARWRDQCLAGCQARLRGRETNQWALKISHRRSEMGEITLENELLRERPHLAAAAHPFAVAETEAVTATVSPSARKQYCLARVCRVLELARPTVRAHWQRALMPAPRQRSADPGRLVGMEN